MRHTRTIRLSHTEEKIIEAAAMLAGIGISVFLREAGIAAAGKLISRGADVRGPVVASRGSENE